MLSVIFTNFTKIRSVILGYFNHTKNKMLSIIFTKGQSFWVILVIHIKNKMLSVIFKKVWSMTE